MIAKVKFVFNIEADREAVQRFECGRREFRYLGILEMSLRNSPSLLRLFIYIQAGTEQPKDLNVAGGNADMQESPRCLSNSHSSHRPSIQALLLRGILASLLCPQCSMHNGASNEIKEIKVCNKCPKVKPYSVPISKPTNLDSFFQGSVQLVPSI